MLNYTLYGETETTIYEAEISLAEAIFTVFTGIVWGLLAAWYLAPIQYIINILHLRDIKFKCEK